MNTRLNYLKLHHWIDRPITLNGLYWSVALPVGWLALFYGLVVHTRFSLGRWPNFGERFNGWLGLHERAVWLLIPPLYFSIYAATLVFLVCLFFRRLRHLSIYALVYAAAFLLDVLAASFLSPGPFLNWFLD